MDDGLGRATYASLSAALAVLILVLMDDGLGQFRSLCNQRRRLVLILVLMDDGLGQAKMELMISTKMS